MLAIAWSVLPCSYTGSTVYGRRYYDIIGQSHSVKVSKKDWIIVPDVHEPIVSREEFDRAQAALKEYKERDVVAGPKSKIRCGGCGHAITSQISNYFFSGAKRRLAVYDPLFAAANVQEFLVCIRKFLFEKGQEFAPEFSGKHPNGQEEFLF